MTKRWYLLAIATVLFLTPSPANALKVIEVDGFNIYFPEDAGPLAERIASWCGPMAVFLEKHNLPVTKPLHILLDKELDQPKTIIQLYPHREIRLPMRAPGVFEDGYTESDPWQYYLFKGLCDLGIYNERSGLPAGVHRIFGEIISPNTILPEWTIDGISHLLFELYAQRRVTDPLGQAILYADAIPNLDRVSHHPEIWPGKFSYRIYGRPFIRWLYERYGWDKILYFLQLHGGGIVPIEIDLKAKRAFGISWNQLWYLFQFNHTPTVNDSKGVSIVGYWNMPHYYWNEMGVYPGIEQPGYRSRYGYLSQQNWLWLSQYTEGTSQIKLHRRGAIRKVAQDHVWDPGPGAVAVTRRGYIPYLVVFGQRNRIQIFGGVEEEIPVKQKIDGPVGVLQMSGPVMDDQGRIAVAANTEGNWDIWLFDKKWYRVTQSPSIEIDPWWIDGKLIFSSNVTGKFQICGTDLAPLTEAPIAALLPRGSTYLDLQAKGWHLNTIDTRQIPELIDTIAESHIPASHEAAHNNGTKDYSAWKTMWPNYIVPDYFFNNDDFQLGLSTNASDISRAYTWNAGARYDIDDGHVTWRLGYNAKELSTRVTRYPLKYTTQRDTSIDELRIEVNLSWSPITLQELTLSTNWRQYVPQINDDGTQEDWWASVTWKDRVGSIDMTLGLDAFNDNSKSVYGELLYGFGEKVNTIMRLQGGKTWGDLNPGHNTFRIGGNSGEGYFTQRSSRLFSLRGFDSNIIEARQAVSASVDILWPFASLQAGYKTLPFFLHNITVGTFIDAGFAADHFNGDEIFVSAGIELITGMQLAWDKKSNFSIGLAWPLRMPSDIEQSGPAFLILIGRPL